ncbi:patatin-like phospholipase family protein [Pukyongiella litopenaei]|uniref:Patatin-like phospholipase family protein n=1 Tax=Pukyongiella litopenaei TaxID=2605946 RepID=A0A2S0MUL4_9RHOB|nr:patatin-like phospholipase family protein [Pukyongiella litopenaei]AVO39586.1 patatin-like phospholipase family protein [Pukyongiella litopenaei]
MRRINLALQGGGAHGAFTWGVLDYLLERDDIEIAGISGTSAGALNGAALKAGLLRGGREGARDELDRLWTRMGAVENPVFADWLQFFDLGQISRGMAHSPVFAAADIWTRVLSPYASGSLYAHPLRSVVDAFDFDRVCADDGPALFICATRVRSGKVRIFKGREISTDAILASACLPTLFRAIEIDDPETGQTEAYWDGGYTGNPALFPLFDSALPEDIVIVNINPLERDAVPVTAQDIQNRINEISFNSSLLRELRAIAFVQRLLEDGTLKRGRMARVLLHMIADDALMNDLSVATKTVPHPVVLTRLKRAGRAAAARFLDAHRDDIGARSSIDLAEMFG